VLKGGLLSAPPPLSVGRGGWERKEGLWGGVVAKAGEMGQAPPLLPSPWEEVEERRRLPLPPPRLVVGLMEQLPAEGREEG
jgi:hypothetical protein